VQIALLPEQSPQIPGWDAWLYSRPANDVGGDLLDFIKIEEGVFGISLGDVSGKALPAALLMAQLQSTIRAVISFSDSGSDLVAKVNAIFHRYELKKSFISLVFMTLKPASGEIKFVNAGHPPPLLVCGGKLSELPRGGLAIGLKKELSIPEQRQEIGAGDCLVVYSDGVVDARNQAEEFFGTERLHQALLKNAHLSSLEMGERILSEIDAFVQEAPRYDDLSLVIIKRAAAPAF
jgi:sigma-B regulation protein RsbU (phosphoserine phosphatase)